jgi:hypothetical protein
MQSSFSTVQPHQLGSIPATQGSASSEALWGFQPDGVVQSSSSIPQSFSTDIPLNPALSKKKVTFGPDQIIYITPRQTQSLLSCESIPTPMDEDERGLPILLQAPPSGVWESQASSSTQDVEGDECVDATPCLPQITPSTNAATALLSRSTNIFGAGSVHSAAAPPATSCVIDWTSVSEDSLGVQALPAETPRNGDSLPLLDSMSSSSTFDAAATFAVICGSSSVGLHSSAVTLGQPLPVAESEDDSMGPLPMLTAQVSSTGEMLPDASPCSAVGYKEPSQDDAASPLIAEQQVGLGGSDMTPNAQLAGAVDPTPEDAHTFATQRQNNSVASSVVPLRQLESIVSGDDAMCATQDLGDYAAAFLSKHDSGSFGSVSSLPAAEDFRTPPRGSSSTTPSGLSTTRGLPRGPQCVFCGASDASVVLHSGYYLHIACALWCPEVYCDSMTEQLKHISDGVTRGASLRCDHCHHLGATVGCLDEVCQRSYHYPCALLAGCAVSPSCPADSGTSTEQQQSVFEPDEKFVMRCPQHSTPSATKDRRGRKRDRD